MTATGVGIVRWQPKQPPKVYSYTVKTLSTMDSPGRWRLIIQRLWKEIEIGSTLMVVETLPPGRIEGSGQLIERAGLLALVRYGCDARGVPVALINPKTLKKFATGHGGAGKGDMVGAARSELKALPHNDNEADALWLAAMGCYQYGGPLLPATLTRQQKEAVGVVRWPHWDVRQ